MRDTLPKASRHRAGVKTAMFAAVSLATMFLLVLSGCPSPLNSRDAETGAETGTLSLTIGSARGRTALPVGPVTDDFTGFEIVLTNGNDDTIPISDLTDLDEIQVPAGTWDLLLRAFLYPDANPVAEGAATFTVAAGGTATAEVTLGPVGAGDGRFEWSILVPAAVDSAELRIWPLAADPETDTPLVGPLGLAPDAYGIIAGNQTLLTGHYLAVFTVLDPHADDLAELTVVLRVYRNMISRFAHEVDEFEFRGTLLELIADAWTGTNFDTPYGTPDIEYGHFGVLGIGGVNIVNFQNLVDEFATILGTTDFPSDRDALVILVDTALVRDGIGNDFSIWIYDHDELRSNVEDVIEGFAVNGTDVDFAWDPPVGTALVIRDMLTVTVGGHVIGPIEFSGDMVYPTSIVIYRDAAFTDAIPDTEVLSLMMGTTLPVFTRVYPAEARPFNPVVAWTINPEGQVTIGGGIVTPHSTGTVTIVAVVDGETGDVQSQTVTINVVPVPVPVQSVTITRYDGETIPHDGILLEVGEEVILVATVLPANADNLTVTWAGFDANVVLVSNSESQAGNVSTIRIRGDSVTVAPVTITATANGEDDAVDVTVLPEPFPHIVYRWVPSDMGVGENPALFEFTTNNGNPNSRTVINGINWRSNGGSGTRIVDGTGIHMSPSFALVLGLVDPTASQADTNTIGGVNSVHRPGIFNFAVPTVLYIDFENAAGPEFQVQVNNTTGTQANSVHGTASRIGGSHDLASIIGTSGTFRLLIPSALTADPPNEVAILTSTLTLRLGSAVDNSLRITRIELRRADFEPASSVTISGPNEVPEGMTVTLATSVLPLAADPEAVSWEIVSGSASIVGSTTGRKIILQGDAEGAVVVRAFAGTGTDTHNITVTAPPNFPLFHRLFDTNPAATNGPGVGPLPVHGANGLSLQGGGQHVAANFRGNVFWAENTTVAWDSFRVEIDIDIANSSFPTASNNSRVGIFISPQNPAAVTDFTANGFRAVATVQEGSFTGTHAERLSPRRMTMVGPGAFAAGGAFLVPDADQLTAESWQGADTLTLGIRSRTGLPSQPQRPGSFFRLSGGDGFTTIGTDGLTGSGGNVGTIPGEAQSIPGSDFLPTESEQRYYVAVFINNNTTALATVVIRELRVWDNQDGTGEPLRIPLNTVPITTIPTVLP